ncbi:MAG: ParA family protein [Thermodesulfobacteriota bacterium]
MAVNQTRIVAVANEKGGVGKTAMVVNLGAALAARGQKVLIVDMDPQHNATYGVGIQIDDEMPNIYDLINSPGEYAAADAVCKTKWDNLSLIPSHSDLAGAEVELVDEAGRESRLRDALADIIGDYDVILIDTPPSLSLLTINVFAFASEVLVPCQTQPYAYRALAELFDTIEAVRTDINPDIEISGVIPTFFDQRTRVSLDILDRLRSDDRYCDLVYQTPIRNNTTIAASSDAGKPVVFYRTTSNGARDYKALAEEFAG